MNNCTKQLKKVIQLQYNYLKTYTVHVGHMTNSTGFWWMYFTWFQFVNFNFWYIYGDLICPLITITKFKAVLLRFTREYKK